MQKRANQTWKILAPIDLTVDSELPVEHAINVASTLDADLMLLYVVNHGGYMQARRVGWPPNVAGGSRKYFDVHRIVLPGDTAETVTRYADFANADLLLITSENFGREARFWRRSVTADIMKATGRPVWVADLQSVGVDYQFRCRRILCVLHLDGTDDAVIHHAEALAQKCGGELILWSVVPEISEGLLHEVLPKLDRPLSRRQALERMQELAKALSVPYKTSVMIGSPYAGIRVAARDHVADVVVAARAVPEQAGLYCLDMRSLRRRLSCPLLSVAAAPAAGLMDEATEATPEIEHALTL